MRLVRESIYEDENPYFKGPSREQIEKAIVGMSLEERFKKAIENNVPWLITDCINNGFDPSWSDNWGLHYTINKNIKELLYKDERVRDSQKLIDIFVDSINYDILWLVKFCLDNGQDPTTNDNWALIRSCEDGYYDIVKFLLRDKRINPSYINNLSIRKASINGDIDIVRLLLSDNRVDPSAVNNDAIRCA